MRVGRLMGRVLGRRADGVEPSLPPEELITLVAGTPDTAWFLEGGRLGAEAVAKTLAAHGVAIERLNAVLDFGCGCGRVLRHFRGLAGPKLYGTDYNPKLLDWSRGHLPFVHFRLTSLNPPLPYGAESFDLVYALSVFTHLSEDLGRAWIADLDRVLKPGGYLYLTLHGSAHLPVMTKEEQLAFGRGEFVGRQPEASGKNDCAAFHVTCART